MKYQPLHDLIDPEVPPEGAVVEGANSDGAAVSDDAYVIGENRAFVHALDAKPAKKRRSGRRSWVKPAAALLGVACVALTVWNLARVASGPPAPPKPTPRQVKQALYLGVMKVEAYRRLHGVTPESLRDAGLPEPPYVYRRVGPTQYVMSIQEDGPRLEYDSNIPADRFFGPAKDILAMGGPE